MNSPASPYKAQQTAQLKEATFKANECDNFALQNSKI